MNQSGSKNSKILLTRPTKSSQKIAKILTDKNLSYLIQPLFSVVKIKNLLPIEQALQAVLITSSNAVFALKKLDIKKDVLILAVGEKTAKKINKLGYKNVISANNSAASLLELSKEKLSKNNGLDSSLVLYLSGEIITLDLKEKLCEKGFEAERLLVYKTKEAKKFLPKIVNEIKNGNVSEVWIYSKNSEKIFYKLAKKHNLLEYLMVIKILYPDQIH